MDNACNIIGTVLYDNKPKNQQEMTGPSLQFTQEQAKYQHLQGKQVPVTLVEHMTDPRAAQLQMMFASLDERGKKTAHALISALYRLHKGEAT